MCKGRWKEEDLGGRGLDSTSEMAGKSLLIEVFCFEL